MRTRLVAALSFLAAVIAPHSLQAQEVDYLRVLLNRPMPWAFKLLQPPKAQAELRRALQWRALTVRDENGQVPAGARYKANLQRRKSLVREGRPGRMEALSASISPAAWVSRGPQNCGGRTRALLIDSANPSVLYAGAATGGVWKSTNGGATWTPLTDFMTNINISTMVMDPGDPNTIYVGTGEGMYSDHGPDGLPGAGIFKTTNGGSTWTQLAATANWRYVKKLSMQPDTSGVLLVANELGIFRSTDGGSSWVLVYDADPDDTESVADDSRTNFVAYDPKNANRAVADASTPSGYKRLLYSGDGGLTWSAAASIPDTMATTNDIAVAWATWPDAPSDVYVNIGIIADGGLGKVWRSTDGGVHYSQASPQGATGCANACSIWVAPANSNENHNLIVVGAAGLARSVNGGLSYVPVSSTPFLGNDPHVDTHFLVHETGTSRLYVAGDGGIYVTADITAAASGSGWSNLNATYQTSQFYAAAGHAAGYGPIVGGAQDNGSLRVSISDQTSPDYRAATTANHWLDGDGGFVVIDPVNPSYLYGERQGQEVFRSTNGGESYGIESIMGGLVHQDAMAIAPLVMDPNDHNTLLSGGLQLWRMNDATSTTPHWSSISPTFAPISAIAVAKGNSNIIWVGLMNGGIKKTTNGTATPSAVSWTDVDDNFTPTNPLPNRIVLRIVIDPDDSNRVYVALGGYTANSPAPQNLWRTKDGGTHWEPISGIGNGALPLVPIRTIARHPRNQQRLYVGTDIGIYESEDGGVNWSTTQQGPADVTVDELSYVYGSELLLAATHGRGLWTANTSSVPAYTPYTPGGLVAAASGTTAVNVSWPAIGGATNYQLFRSADGLAYAERALLTSTSFNDTSVEANKTYLYKVRAYNGTWSDLSAPDLATTIVFQNDNTLAGQLVTAAVMQELVNGANDVLTAAGLTPSLSAPAAGTPITASSVVNVRTALSSAYNAIGMPAAPSFSQLAAGSPVLATFVQEVRNAVK